MSNHFSKHSMVSRQSSMRVIGMIGWALSLLVISALVITPLSEHTDCSTVVTNLADIRVTPVWPQIGLFSTPAH